MENKQDFLTVFQKHIKTLPKKEQTELIADYEEHFELALFEGRSEKEIIDGLGNPKKLAKEHVMDFYLNHAQKIRSYRSLVRAISASLGSGLINLIKVLIPFLAIAILIATLFLVSFALILTPLSAIASILTGIAISQGILQLFITLVLLGLGILILLATIRFTRYFYQWFTDYLQNKLQLIRGENK